MPALSLTDPNLVWQHVKQSLTNADPVSQNAFRDLKLQMATQKLNVQLQFVPFGEADVDAATGYTGAPSGPFTLYGVWAKKTGTGTTVAFLQLRNQLAVAGTGATGVLAEGYFKAGGATGGDEWVQINPKGLPFSQTTGACILSATACNGQTQTAADADSQHGFLIIGA